MYPPSSEVDEFTPDVELPEEVPLVEDESASDSVSADSEVNEEDPIEFSEEIKKALTDLLKSAREEDRFVRDNQLLLWKKLEHYWNNILDIFFDQVSKDWRIPDWGMLEESGEVPPRLINIYRPLGEAVIAALSVQVPAVVYHPDDADNPDDIETAKAYRAINGLVASHNDDTMLFIRALMILFNQGTVFAYNYYHTDPKFGTIKTDKIEFKDISTFQAYCPQCGEGLDAGIQGKEEEIYQCPTCGYSGPAELSTSLEKFPQIVGWDNTPKGTICREMYSGLNVKVPAYAKDQANCGYLLLEFAQSAAMLRSIFKDVEGGIDIEAKYDNSFESFSKLPIQYLGEQPDNAANVACLWLRPWQYYQLGNSSAVIVEQLLKKYPDGCYCIFVNDVPMVAQSENMDEHWSISKNPMGSFIYARPLGENLATVQDIRAQLVEIEIQTAEYGIPETFVDSQVLDFQTYGQGQAKPGMVTPVKPRAGKSIADAFYTTKTAILSQEISPLKQSMDQDAQLVSSAFPSIYGGLQTGGSNTATEYTQSKAMALQRLGTTWKIVCEFWTQVQSKSAVEYANIIKELDKDERFTKQEGNGNFVNVWIRKSSLNGKVGRVEPEASEQLPQSWSQKKDAIFQLLQAGVPEILAVLTHPNNAGMMKNAIGLSDIYVPGEEARIKQYKEFQQLSQGMPVPINPLVDNEQVHIEVLQFILEGPLGESLSEEGFGACMQHLQMHMDSMAQKAAQEMENNPESGSAPGAKKEQVKENV
jgi:predicted RNA-binding Zn-ribbon protein involved in translation (DUF1610 family)